MYRTDKNKSQSRAVFTMTIEHRVAEDNNGTHYQDRWQEKLIAYSNLAPNGNFHVQFRNPRERNKNDGVANYGDVKDLCEKVINEEIVGELRELIDVPIKEVKVNRTYEGSLIVVFSVLFNIYQFIGGIAGFHDTLKLIENTVRRHMKKRLDDEFRTNGYFEVNVNAEKDYDYRYMLCDMSHFGFRKHGSALTFPMGDPYNHVKRDAFFWYLLISNIVLMITLGILVGKAVISVYL